MRKRFGIEILMKRGKKIAESEWSGCNQSGALTRQIEFIDIASWFRKKIRSGTEATLVFCACSTAIRGWRGAPSAIHILVIVLSSKVTACNLSPHDFRWQKVPKTYRSAPRPFFIFVNNFGCLQKYNLWWFRQNSMRTLTPHVKWSFLFSFLFQWMNLENKYKNKQNCFCFF